MTGGLPNAPRWAWIVMAGGLVAIAVMAPIAFGRGEPSSAEAERLRQASPSAATTDAAEPVVVSVLSDSHAYNEGSWFRRTVEAGAIPGVQLGAFASQPGADTETIANKLDEAAAGADFVLVQGGTNDLLSADTAEEAATGVQGLLQGIRDRGPTPVLVLTPPSDTRGSQTAELNDLLREYAAANGIAVIDDYTVVANPDGTWKGGLSGDGVHAQDPGGTTLMADEVLKQLPAALGLPG